jgi:hypothetical protein
MQPRTQALACSLLIAGSTIFGQLITVEDAFAVTIILRGAYNGESADFADKLVPITPDNAIGTFDGTALAIVPLGTPSVKTTGSSGKGVGATGSTGIATKTAGGVTPAALGNWKVAAGGAGHVLLTTKGSYATVVGPAAPRGVAIVRITDPMRIESADPSHPSHPSLANTDLDLTFGFCGSSPLSGCGSTPSDSTGNSFALQGLGDGFSEITDVVGTNIPGFSTLFQWDISLDSQDNLNVVFTSNPSLGLSDGTIEAAILSALTANFNASTVTYSLPTDFNYLTDLVVPVGNQATVDISWDTTAMAVSGVAEPSSLCLLGVGLVVFGIARRQGQNLVRGRVRKGSPPESKEQSRGARPPYLPAFLAVLCVAWFGLGPQGNAQELKAVTIKKINIKNPSPDAIGVTVSHDLNVLSTTGSAGKSNTFKTGPINDGTVEFSDGTLKQGTTDSYTATFEGAILPPPPYHITG